MYNKKKLTIKLLIVSFFLYGCSDAKESSSPQPKQETVRTATPNVGSINKEPQPLRLPEGKIVTGTTTPAELLDFARTLIGIPYLYASIDPANGFDCSGFITYVFNHFSIAVPRSSVDFTNYGTPVIIDEAKPGDLILFTGTDSTVRIVGHMGIVESIQDDKLYFIHSTSGKAKGVVITPFENYYRGRFVKVIRIFPDEFFE